MSKKVKALTAEMLLTIILMTSCRLFPLSEDHHPKVIQGSNQTGTLYQQSTDGTLSNDSENGYKDTERFLSELAIPEQIVSEFNDEELDFFAKSDSVAAFSNDGEENSLDMRQIIAMHTTGKMRLYTDIEWNSLPVNQYNDLISINMLPQLLPSYKNASLSVSYNGITKRLSPEKDYKIIICDDLGQVGVQFDLKKALENITEIGENSVRIRFQIDVFNAAYLEYEYFNVQLIYQHLHTPYKGEIGETPLGYKFTEKSRIHMTYYEIGPSVPLSYFPEGFQKPE